MAIRRSRQEPPAGRSLHESLLHQIWLDDFLDRIARFAKRRGDGFNPHGSAAKILGYEAEVALIEGVKPFVVHFEPPQCLIRDLGIHFSVAANRGEITHPFEQSACDARRAAGASRDLACAVLAEIKTKNTGASCHDQAKF